MRIQSGILVPLGYGKYVRSDRVTAVLPIEQERGPMIDPRFFTCIVLFESAADDLELRAHIAQTSPPISAA